MGRGKSGRAGLIAAVIAAAVVLQLAGKPLALFAIGEYRAHVSPHLRGIVVCRFTPTCSAYGAGAIRKYGFYVGTAKTAWRIMRCGPWTKAGTYDPP